MNLRFTPRARDDAGRAHLWWQRNRPAAPSAFERELNATLERIRVSPSSGVLHEQGDLDVPVRRVLMPRTRHHLYYTLDGEDLVILSVWGAQRARGPSL